MTHVMACIDNSQSSLTVCDYAAWASQRLSAPLTLLHVLDKEKYPASVRALSHQAVSGRQHDHDDAANIHFTRIAASLSQFHWPQYFQNCGNAVAILDDDY